MNCCPPCRSSGSSLAGVAAVIGAVVIADRVCVWVADRIWWIGGMVVVSFALAVAISMWLESLAERCGARFAERHGIRSRADVQVEPVSDRKVATYLSPVAVPAALPPAGPAALGPPPKSWLCETCYWAWPLDVPFCGVCGHSRAATARAAGSSSVRQPGGGNEYVSGHAGRVRYRRGHAHARDLGAAVADQTAVAPVASPPSR